MLIVSVELRTEHHVIGLSKPRRLTVAREHSGREASSPSSIDRPVARPFGRALGRSWS